MQKHVIRLLTVQQRFRISPHMQRVILVGDALADFPEHHESANFKLLLLPDDVLAPLSLSAADIKQRAIVRTYTLRHFDRQRSKLWVDFMLHADHGPASHWALNADIGSYVGFAGPGSPKLVKQNADWYFFAGDMSALPAIAANLERLPASAKGHAVLEVLADSDRLPLSVPRGMNVTWVINPHPEKASSLLFDAVQAQPWLSGAAAVWVAGESGVVGHLRRYMKQQRIDPDSFYASGYWQIGLTEDRHQLVKRAQQDADRKLAG